MPVTRVPSVAGDIALFSRARDVITEYGESGVSLGSAIADANSESSRAVLKLAGQYDVDASVTLLSDVALRGEGGNGFNQTSIRAASDITALQSRDVDTGGGDNTVRVLVDHLRLNAANNVANPALHLRRQFLSTLSHFLVSPGSVNANRYGALLELCDSVRFLDFAWTEFPSSGSSWPTLIDVDSTNTDIKFTVGSFESTTGSQGRSIFRGKGTSWLQVQFERQDVIIDGNDCVMMACAGGQSNFYLGSESVDTAVMGLRNAYSFTCFHPFVTLANVKSRNMQFSGTVDFTRGTIQGVSNTRDRWAVSTGDELLVGVRITARDTGTSGPVQIISGTSGNDVRTMSESFSLDDIGATSYGVTEHDRAGLFLAVRANTGDTALSITSDHWEHARVWTNRLARGSLRSDAGAFDVTGWEYTTCSVSERRPWHASQAWQHPSATFATSGTALTASASLTDATVGQYVCVEQTLAGTFTISGTAVTGSGTDFTTLSVGDAIYSSSNDEWLEIETITDATNAVLQKAPAANVTTPENLVTFQARKLTAIGSATAGTLAAAFAANVSSATPLKLAEAWGQIDPSADGFAFRQDDTTISGLVPGQRFAMIARIWGRVDMTAEGNPTFGSPDLRPLIYENPSSPPLTLADGSVIAMIVGEHSYNSLNRCGFGLISGGSGLAAADRPRIKWAALIDLD